MSSKTLVEGNGGNGNLAVKRDAEQQDATPYLEVYSPTLRPRSEKSLASSTSVDDMELELVPSTIATSELSPSTQPIATSVTTSAAPSAPTDTASEPEPSTTYQFYVHQGVYATDVDPHPEPSQAPPKKDPPKEDPPKKDPPKKDPPKTDPTPIMPVNVDETPRSTRSKYPYPNQNIYATKVDPRPEPSVNTPKKDPPKKDPPKKDPPTKPKHSTYFYVHHGVYATNVDAHPKPSEVPPKKDPPKKDPPDSQEELEPSTNVYYYPNENIYATDVDAQPESSETPPKKDLPNQKRPGTSYVNTRIYATDVDAQSEPSETPYFPPDDEENPDESRPPQPYVYPGIYATEVDSQPEPSNTAEPEPSYRKQSYVNTRVYATRVDPRPKHTKNPPQKDAPHTKEHKVKPQNRPTTYPTPTGGEYLPIQTGTRIKQRPGHSKTRHHDGPQPTGQGDDRQDDDGQDDHWKDDDNQDDDDQDDNEQNGNDQNSDDQDDDNRDRIPIHTGPVGSHPVTVYTTDKRGATQTLLIDSHPVTVFATDESGASQTLLIESPTYIDGSLILPPAATSNTQPTPNAAIATENASDKNKIDYRVYVFSGQYLSTVIAVLLSMLWKVIDTDIKRIEPFYLLSHASGTPASTLTENLLFANSYFIPLQAAWRRQWVVCLSAIVYFPLLAGVQFLAPATVFLNTATKCDIFATTRTCDNPYLAARRVTARFLQGVLGCVIVAVIAIIVLQRRRKSLLHSEPWSLAGLAALLADWGAIRDGFSGIDVGDSEEDLKRKVSGRHHQYRLANGEYRGKPHLGIEVVKNPFETVALDTLDATAAPNTSEMYLSPENTSRRPLMLRSYTLIVFELFLVGVLTLILVYRFTNADNSKMERFMSGESIWVKFLFISLGITIRFGWEPIERGTSPPPHACTDSNTTQKPVTSKSSTFFPTATNQSPSSSAITPAPSP